MDNQYLVTVVDIDGSLNNPAIYSDRGSSWPTVIDELNILLKPPKRLDPAKFTVAGYYIQFTTRRPSGEKYRVQRID